MEEGEHIGCSTVYLKAILQWVYICLFLQNLVFLNAKPCKSKLLQLPRSGKYLHNHKSNRKKEREKASALRPSGSILSSDLCLPSDCQAHCLQQVLRTLHIILLMSHFCPLFFHTNLLTHLKSTPRCISPHIYLYM